MENSKKYKIELLCDYAQWWRYNIYASIVCYDSQDQIIDYVNLVDKVFDTETGAESRQIPAGYNPARPIVLESTSCDHAVLYLYVIANTFPESTVIRDSPPFEAELIISCNGEVAQRKHYDVNQWGGFTVSGLRIE